MSSSALAGVRRALLELVYRGQPVCVLLDALDELSPAGLRTLAQPTGPVAIWHERPSTQVVLTARDNLENAVPWAKPRIVQLRQISRSERDAYWRAWRGAGASALITRVLHDPVLNQLLDNPFLAALAVTTTTPGQITGGTDGPKITRSRLLRDAVPRLLRSQWRGGRADQDDSSVEVHAMYARELAWQMATRDLQWNATWPVADALGCLSRLVHPRLAVLVVVVNVGRHLTAP